MPATKSVSSPIPLRSLEHRVAIDACPKCGSRNIRGPYDTRVMATFLYTRTWCCLACWWDRTIEMKDDIKEAEVKHARAQARNKKRREQARRT